MAKVKNPKISPSVGSDAPNKVLRRAATPPGLKGTKLGRATGKESTGTMPAGNGQTTNVRSRGKSGW